MDARVSRRGFVVGGALGIAGASSVLSCPAAHAQEASAPAGQAPAEAASQAAAAVTTDAALIEPGNATYGAILNPQLPLEETTDYAALFEPLTIAGKTMRCRIGKSAAGSETQFSSDKADDTYMQFYRAFAKGGVGLICFEGCNVFEGDLAGGAITGTNDDMKEAKQEKPGSKSAVNINMNSDDCIPVWKGIADEMHKYDVLILGQMLDMMMSNGSSSTHMASGPLETSFANGKMQTTEEVQAEIKAFVDGAERFYKAGWDGVELNASCNHYFSTFLSRFANNERTDQYSGETLENRARVLTEIIQGIRERVGEDFIIQVLYSGFESSVSDLGFDENYMTLDEACEFGKLFEAAGASCLHIRSQAYGHHCGGFIPDAFHIHEHGETGYGSVIDYGKHFGGKVDGSHDGYGALIDVAAEVRKHVSIPVGCVGSMDANMAPDLVNNAVRDGKIDYVLANRSLMADPELPNKLKEGRRDEVAPCTRCLTCFVAPFDLGIPLYCRVNPAHTRALSAEMPEGFDPVPAEEPKNVLVVGGGPAGMEAARIAAQRGHKVTLVEREESLGGRLQFVQEVKGPHEKVMAHEQWLERQLAHYGVNVVTGTEVTAETVAAQTPDAVVVAVGGVAVRPDVEGIEAAITLDELEASAVEGQMLPVGDRVVIYGAQFQACELAINLLKTGKKVTIVNAGPESDFFLNAPTWPRLTGKRWLAYKGLEAFHDVTDVAVADGAIGFFTPAGVSMSVEFDTLVVATPLEKQRDLYDELVVSGDYEEVYAVGDCYAPSTIANATARGNVAARWIGREGANPLTVVEIPELEGDVFTATASGIGDVTVSIGVKDGAIIDAAVDTSGETEGVGKGLGDVFAEQIVEQGSIDAVSGATVTSSAAQTALADCLAQAGLA